jgi:hypothetical protein
MVMYLFTIFMAQALQVLIYLHIEYLSLEIADFMLKHAYIYIYIHISIFMF